MATVTFILKTPSGEAETPIYMAFWTDQDWIRLSTGLKIHPDNWNQKERRARETQRFKKFESVNRRLDAIQEQVEAAYLDHMNRNKALYLDRLQEEMKNIIRPKPDKSPEPIEKMTLFKSIDEIIQNGNRKPWTIKHYKTTLNALRDYQSTLKRELDFEDINIDFYEDFVKYLTKVKIKKDKKAEEEEPIEHRHYAYNTIGTHIKNVKVFMNNALDKGYTTHAGHLHKKFKTLEETADTIYLNEKELLALYELDLSDNKSLEHQRDLFIIGAYTGLRFSDLTQIGSANIIKGGTRIRVRTAKTGETVEIPLHWTIRAILQKYEWTLPKSISDQKMNDYLKKIGKRAGLKQTVIKTMTRGGFQVSKHHKKWELITVHTARRSFATNAYLAGVPTISIMKITGHRTEKAFLKYIKITQEQNADLISKHPFFSQSPLKIAK